MDRSSFGCASRARCKRFLCKRICSSPVNPLTPVDRKWLEHLTMYFTRQKLIHGLETNHSTAKYLNLSVTSYFSAMLIIHP